jgi:BRCT domain type II-containing protein
MEEDLKMEKLDSEQDHNSGTQSNQNKNGSKATNHPTIEEGHLSDSDSEQEIDDILDRVPPDFALANKHMDANRVKNISEDAEHFYDDENDFCP